MKIPDMIDTILTKSQPSGTFPLPEMIRFAEEDRINGIAISKENEKLQYLAILNGEVEGAIFIDEKGTLYGDNAVMLITGVELFTLYGVSPELVTSMIAGCRIFEKAHLKKENRTEIPEFGKKNAGLGIFTLTLQRNNEPQNGVRVSLRKDGKVVGSDVTTQDGSVGFKLMHGRYAVIVQDRNQQLTTFHVEFLESSSHKILEM
ncbi:MAG: hypothetical protein Q8S57_07935 [Methanoregula sp.]|nr:hypothetical protein [Methanoregula sp.]